MLGGERRSAAAGRRGIRVANDELSAFEILSIVDLGACEVLNAHRIDDERDALILDLRVAFFDALVEGKSILESRAPTALHENAKLEVGIRFFANELTDLRGCGVGKNQGRSSLDFSVHSGKLTGVDHGAIKYATMIPKLVMRRYR